MRTPTSAIEWGYWAAGLTRLAGVDEVGRGCLAGPVVAAACILPPGCGMADFPGVRDSKLLSARQRGALVPQIRSRALAVGIGAASRAEIDRLNVRAASVLAMRRAVARLGEIDYLLVDGPLPPEFDPSRGRGIIQGDACCLSIACASILAKEARDGLMARLARRHPEFGWDRNAGYATEVHRQALERLGPTPHHRRSFQPVQAWSGGPDPLTAPAAAGG